MTYNNIEEFRTQKLQEGYDEVLERVWEPNFSNAPRDHPFDTDAVVAKGEYWLTMHGKTTHLKTGDSFQVARGVVHSERYGPQGAVFWAARKN